MNITSPVPTGTRIHVGIDGALLSATILGHNDQGYVIRVLGTGQVLGTVAPEQIIAYR